MLTLRVFFKKEPERCGAGDSAQSEEDLAGFEFHGVGRKVDTGRGALGLTSGEVETPVVFGAFDDPAHDKAAGQMHLAVGAETVGGVILVIGGTIYGKGALAVVEAAHILAVDVAGGADLDPVLTHALKARAVGGSWRWT